MKLLVCHLVELLTPQMKNRIRRVSRSHVRFRLMLLSSEWKSERFVFVYLNFRNQSQELRSEKHKLVRIGLLLEFQEVKFNTTKNFCTKSYEE